MYFPERDSDGKLILGLNLSKPSLPPFQKFTKYYHSIGVYDPDYIRSRWAELATHRAARAEFNRGNLSE